MFNPNSTYRVQFHSGFTFADFEAIIPYLSRLGISTIYASPIFAAVPGSTHGYDGTDPNVINPEIGSISDLKRISAKLNKLDMKWIQDIVPNHMAYDAQNSWLMDVLKNGEASVYREYFDILSADLNQDPLMAPFLGKDLQDCIRDGELELVKIEQDWFVRYGENTWPLRAGTNPEDSLEKILSQQYYRLCTYTEANARMNYRRFFTVNSLICLNIQNEKVFEHYHRLIKDLVDARIFHGLRIDHIDGLMDPAGYLSRLRQLCGGEVYIVVEKILEPGEQLPSAWPVQGTTGYDFLGLANQLFTNEKAENKFSSFYKNLQHKYAPVTVQIRKKKESFLNTYMQGELDNLCQLIISTPVVEKANPDEGQIAIIRQIIAELLVRCPVYRFYGNGYPLDKYEKKAIDSIFRELEEIVEYRPSLKLIRKVLLEKNIHCYQRLMQISGPLMAKGVEDTLMYTYNRFIGNNEVGDSPALFGITPDEFHKTISSRSTAWPIAMNATATHDTKRGEDARARLNVLTDIRHVWINEINRWEELNESLHTAGKPDRNDAYFIYQTLIATYPETDSETEDYKDRLQTYIEKALRESKRNSEWEQPDLQYEKATRNFIDGLLNPEREFWHVFSSFMNNVFQQARKISLGSLIIKFGTPGIPDTYQGTEFWDLSMVDPDNRRPVDYAARANFLKEIEEGNFNLADLVENAGNGKIKLYLLRQLLHSRLRNPELYASGLYIPLEIKGKFAAHLIAFARRSGNRWALFVVAINPSMVPDPASDLQNWEDTRVILPTEATGNYHELVHDINIRVSGELSLQDLFKVLPFAVLEWCGGQRERGAGILLHVTSLPSRYGIGDMGPGASDFLENLVSARQQYWQILPINPVTAGQLYSPYSSTSTMAGNVLLISPELLWSDGLVNDGQLLQAQQKNGAKVNFQLVEKKKDKLLKQAFASFQDLNPDDQLVVDFNRFIKDEDFWLDDYALYEVLKMIQQGQPWYHWPERIRRRDKETLAGVKADCENEMQETKWRQFIFYRQWRALRKQANALEIKIIGDLPFYCAWDSVDVWANQQLFSLDKRGRMKAVAGVPPDYFNADGQLWGMPVYNWREMAKTQYRWWTSRIDKNRLDYDLIRLDHFRAFHAYWEVPANESSARFGAWQQGPGADFFNALLKAKSGLPFIAEDLGEITDGVFRLRDHFGLPGMRVLQFAFGADAADSLHAPHNFTGPHGLVYTGTHDNNTLKGWYKDELNLTERSRIEAYTGQTVSAKNIHLIIIGLAYASVAGIAIIPMQDILGKGSASRMNVPASVKDNWGWRMKSGEFKNNMVDYLRSLALRYGR